MTFLIPILISILTAGGFLLYLRYARKIALKGVELIPCAMPTVIVVIYHLVLTALGYTADPLTLSMSSLLFTLAGCSWLRCRKREGKHIVLIRRLSLAVLIIVALELSVFSYSAYASPRSGAVELTQEDAVTELIAGDDGLDLDASAESSASWTVDQVDVKNIALTFATSGDRPLTIKVSVRDGNLSTRLYPFYSDTVIIRDGEPVYLPLSAMGMTEVSLNFSACADTALTGAVLNAPRAVSPNLLRVILLLLLVWAAIVIHAYRLWQAVYRPGRLTQRMLIVIAAALCIIALLILTIPHANDAYSTGSLFYDYNGAAESMDPYYQMFDAFHKGQANLDVSVDERLIAAGDLAYDSGYRTDQGISVHWDRAFYDGKYYSYFGTAPLFLFYYPVYALTGKVPTTAVTCFFFSSLCVIFGFMLIFKLARTVIKEANFLLTLLCAAVLPFMAGLYILTAYGDFYNLPKLCALAFLLLLWYFTVEGYERPRWHIFLICGLCVGVMLASRPNVVIAALGLTPLYIGVLVNRELSVKQKIADVGAFLLPIAVVMAGLMAYNTTRFGSPLEFGAKYQLTVSNIAANNTSLGFLPLALYHFFFQPATLSPSFPYLSPQYQAIGTYTRYFYVTASFGVLALPLNWSLATYPAVSKRSGVKLAYRATIITSLCAAVLVALLDFALAGVTISYVCDIAATVAVAAILVLLMAESAARGHGAVHKGVVIGAAILICMTFVVCILLLLGTQPLFVCNSLPSLYGVLQNLFMI